MKKHYIATAFATSALLAAPAWAQEEEFGSQQAESDVPQVEAPAEEPVGQGVSVEEVKKALDAEIAPAETAEQCLQNYFNAKDGWQMGYDDEKERIVVQEKVEFVVKNPEVSSDFIEKRGMAMQELLIKAKAKIIESILSDMSAERMLSIPGNPIAKQLEKQQKEINAQLKDSLKQLEILGADLDEATQDKVGMLSPGELVAVISNWFLSSEKENLAEKFDADKKERYANAKEAFLEAQKQYDELLKQAEVLKGEVSKELSTSISKVAAMPIYGCTVLQQAESISERNGKYHYQIAIIYYWSMEMQKASGRILTGKEMIFDPGKKSIKAWLSGKAANGALSEWLGPRQFIDDKGHMWFLGISAAACDEDDADNEDILRRAASLEADAEVVYSLFADAHSSQQLNKLAQTKVLADGTKEQKILQDYSTTQSESFKNVKISGISTLFSGTVKHKPSGIDIQVVVSGVDSASPKALKDIQTKAAALGIEVNTYQQKETGRLQQMQKVYEKSKDNPAARAAGAAQANAEIAAEAAKLKKENAPKGISTLKPITGGSTSAQPATKGQLQRGASMIIDDDD